jgi:Collagen triple helix repeat (20 copies)
MRQRREDTYGNKAAQQACRSRLAGRLCLLASTLCLLVFFSSAQLASATKPACCGGPTGPTGASGPTGATGKEGPKGVTGAAGAPGEKGATGATGAEGKEGIGSGTTGATGAAGAAGATGAAGAAGAAGATGAQGTQGVTGATGAEGKTGATGPTGPTGPTGVGETGATGPTGAAGTHIVSGAVGPLGEKAEGSGFESSLLAPGVYQVLIPTTECPPIGSIAVTPATGTVVIAEQQRGCLSATQARFLVFLFEPSGAKASDGFDFMATTP